MNMSEQLNKIKEVGFEEWIANHFLKLIRRKIFFFVLTRFMVGVGLIVGGLLAAIIWEQIDWGIVGILMGCSIVWRCLFLVFWRVRTIRIISAAIYKDELTSRHGDYKTVLREIEAELCTEEIRVGDRWGTFITSNWLIMLCALRGVHFIHKSEMVGIIKTAHTQGINANFIIDNGDIFLLSLPGNSSWEDIFSHFSKDNPYLLSNDDLVANAAGKNVSARSLIRGRTTPTAKYFQKEIDDAKLIAKQYLKNKNAGVRSYWIGSNAP